MDRDIQKRWREEYGEERYSSEMERWGRWSSEIFKRGGERNTEKRDIQARCRDINELCTGEREREREI